MNVSVIIPTYNRGQILCSTIQSYLSDPCVYEVIVVNDGSTDNTLYLLSELQKKDYRIKIYTIDNSGAPAARNYGVMKTDKSTEFIFFGEDDAFIGERAVSKLVESVGIHQADIAGGLIVPIDGLNAPLSIPQFSRIITKPVNLNLMRANFKLPTTSDMEVPFIHAIFLAKKWVFNQVCFDTKYISNAYREETDFCLQANRLGAKILFVPGSLIYHIEVAFGGQRKVNRLKYEIATLKNNWYFLNKHYDFLKNKYKIVTPKFCLQGALVLRRIYLVLKKMLRSVFN